ncbi:ATP-citrate synthase, mitochondrial [Pelomyxa schiedti]|nr:ATP-citrate synthase, mitochondrial [Pelomyxa schiedti]
MDLFLSASSTPSPSPSGRMQQQQIASMNRTRLLSCNSKAILYHLKPHPIQRMLDFDFVCRKDQPSIVGIVHPGARSSAHKVFFGATEILIPIYDSISEAVMANPTADVFINFTSHRTVYKSSLVALNTQSIRVVIIVTEGVPENDVRRLIVTANRNGKTIIGPGTVGAIQEPGAFKVGDTGGTIDNILQCKMYRPGSVGLVTKSSGLANEMCNLIAKTTDGIYECVSVGSDIYTGSTMAEHIVRFEAIEEVKIIVVLGEVGGYDEYEICHVVKEGLVKKPVVAWVIGTCAKYIPAQTHLFHTVFRTTTDVESAVIKNRALAEAGVQVPNSFADLGETISTVYRQLLDSGRLFPAPDFPPACVPQGYFQANKAGFVRRSTGIISTICDDRGDEPSYSGIPISELIQQDVKIGDIIALLWFKRRIASYASRFLELVLILCADHGPCVSAAHSTIVTSRAGKDLMSCLCAGLLSIGPRFGGASDDVARCFYHAVESGLSPEAFVEKMRHDGALIPGIGHHIKSIHVPDKRVSILTRYALDNFPVHMYLNFALEVERCTLQKANNLILNVDGVVGVLFLDMMDSSPAFTKREMKEIVELGYLTGLFALSRSIGLIGHALDQKRLKQPIYRHPYDDVMFAQQCLL